MKNILNFLRSWRNWIKILLFLPIIFVLIISLSHMIDWFLLTDEKGWATFLSTAIVLITFSTIAASRITKWSFLAYSVVFLIELCGNYFHAFTHIKRESKAFQDWNLSIEPIFDLLFYNADVVAKMRFLALIQGGALPILALIFFTFWLYVMGLEDNEEQQKEITEEVEQESEVPLYMQTDVVGENDTVKEQNDTIEEIVEDIEYQEDNVESEPIIDDNDTLKANNDAPPKANISNVIKDKVITKLKDKVSDSEEVTPIKKTYVAEVKDDIIRVEETPKRLIDEVNRIEKKHSKNKPSKQSGEPESRIIDSKKFPSRNVVKKVLKSSNNNPKLKSEKQVKITDSRIRTKKDNFKNDKK